MPALSPAFAPPPSAPVYLLHGAGDNVIPAAESVAARSEPWPSAASTRASS